MVYEKIREIITEQFDIDDEAITPETTWEELGADSLDVVELMMAAEGEFDLEIDDEKAEKIRTVGDLVNCIKKEI